ncbi:hypothetical protein [Burkholderia ubonensis]|uniref:hypothetical protein n=1 Tax=Burkholderia ubonensis TaxID=101571 RepID=UPI0018DFFC41|nr:hypothetical protein [Burkholderia ubonensis]
MMTGFPEKVRSEPRTQAEVDAEQFDGPAVGRVIAEFGDENVEIEALVILSGQIPDNMTIEHVEVLPKTVHIRIADAEPDWMNAPRGPDDDG